MDMAALAARTSKSSKSAYNPKQIQRLMGHSSIKVTFDVYGQFTAKKYAPRNR
jgi:integrase